MKAAILSLLALGTTQAENIFVSAPVSESPLVSEDELKPPLLAAEAYREKYGEDVVVNEQKTVRFGHQETVHEHNVGESVFEKLIELTDSDYYYDYDLQTKHIKEMANFVKGEKNFTQPHDPKLDITCANANQRGTNDPTA